MHRKMKLPDEPLKQGRNRSWQILFLLHTHTLNRIEYLFLDDGKQRFPRVTSFYIAIVFNKHFFEMKMKIIDALEPEENSENNQIMFRSEPSR